jgi:hypothetical protein
MEIGEAGMIGEWMVRRRPPIGPAYRSTEYVETTVRRRGGEGPLVPGRGTLAAPGRKMNVDHCM